MLYTDKYTCNCFICVDCSLLLRPLASAPAYESLPRLRPVPQVIDQWERGGNTLSCFLIQAKLAAMVGHTSHSHCVSAWHTLAPALAPHHISQLPNYLPLAKNFSSNAWQDVGIHSDRQSFVWNLSDPEHLHKKPILNALDRL